MFGYTSCECYQVFDGRAMRTRANILMGKLIQRSQGHPFPVLLRDFLCNEGIGATSRLFELAGNCVRIIEVILVIKCAFMCGLKHSCSDNRGARIIRSSDDPDNAVACLCMCVM